MEALGRRQRLHLEGRYGANPPRRTQHLPRSLARITALAVGLAIAAALGIGQVVSPSTVNAMGPLPPCRYDDILTSPRRYTDWSVTQVDTILRVTKGYVPPDLVSVSRAGIPGKGLIRAIVIDDLRAMSEAAKAAGAAIGIQSAYRSYATQRQVFSHWIEVHGYARALQLSARPGHSEHQLGLGIDFRSHPGGSPFNGTTWASTPAGKWMKAHAWEYGFVMSYPRGKMDVTCYDFEPWHFRYVGRELAGQIRASRMTPREYLWANFTTTIVPAATPKAIVTARPSRRPTAPPTNAPAPIPSPGNPTSIPSTPAETAPPTLPATSIPTLPATSVPTLPATSVPTKGPVPSPAETPLGVDPNPVGSLEPAVMAGLAVALVGGIVLGWMVLRRGRSGVGL